MTCFSSLYAAYYDLMYQDKNYEQEVNAVLKLIEMKHPQKLTSIVSLGAGTLNYEQILVTKGYRVIGLDISVDMVELAQAKIAKNHWPNIEIRQGDMKDFTVADPVDAVLALFNIIAYCRSVTEFSEVVKAAASNLKPGGVFAFDCWNAEAVKKNPPSDRFKKLSITGGDLYRLTTVEKYLPQDNEIDLSIELIEVINDHCRRDSELHQLRCWSTDEIKMILTENGFSEIVVANFPNVVEPPSLEQWPMLIIAKKN